MPRRRVGGLGETGASQAAVPRRRSARRRSPRRIVGGGEGGIRSSRLRAAAAIGVGVALFVSIAFALDWLLVPELKTLDARFMLRGERDDTAEVVVVGIDDASFREMQLQWPWPRTVHADLIDALADAGARAIAFDILFMEPSREGAADDERLAEAARRAGNVIFGQKLTRIVDQQFRTTTLEQPLRILRDTAATTALVNHQPDPDIFARRSYLAMRHQATLHPTLSLAAVALYLGLDPVTLAAEAAGEDAGQNTDQNAGRVVRPAFGDGPQSVVGPTGTLPSGFDTAPPSGFDLSPPGFDTAPPSGFDTAPPGVDPAPSSGFDSAPSGSSGLPSGFDPAPPGSPASVSGSGGQFASDDDVPASAVPAAPVALASQPGPGLAPVRLLQGGPFAGTYMINFRGGVRSIRTVSYYQVLRGTVPPEFLRDKIVFVGAATPDLEDHFATPFLPLGPMPGVELHAHAALTLLRGDALHVPHPLLTILIIVITALVTAFIGGRTSAGVGFLAAAGTVVLLSGYAVWAFNARDVWFQAVPPMASVLLSYTLINAYRFAVEERERRRVQNVFGRYVSQDVVEQILATGGDVPLGGVRQPVTVMFSDIRGFTSLSERLNAEAVVTLLNEYFGAMADVIFEQRGMIDKFMGDAIMAVFGAPLPANDDALRAVTAAVEMRKRLLQLRDEWKAEGTDALDSGIGINTAEVIVGNVGSEERMDYTVIGDGVNLAARLEELSKEYGGGILIAESTYAHVRDHVEVQSLNAVAVRGKTEPVQIYKVLGLRGDAWREAAFGGAAEVAGIPDTLETPEIPETPESPEDTGAAGEGVDSGGSA